jgi:hypothetical protein
VRKSSVALALCLASRVLDAPCVAEEKKPVPAYTNEDLERVKPFRDQTGVASKPDMGTADNERAGTPRRKLGADGAAAGKGRHSAESDEEKWRYQAERFRAKLQPLRDKADDLRDQIEQRRRQPGVRPYSDPRIVADQKRLAVLEQRIRDSESAFEDRARRQGALPGWIR